MQEGLRERIVVWSVAAAVMSLGLAVGLAAIESSLPGAPSTAVVASDVLAGWSFAIVGASLWTHYRSRWIGGLTIAVGLASFLPDIRWFETTVTWTLGSVLSDVHLVILAWLVLAFPSGRLDRNGRVFMTTVAVYFVSLSILGHLFQVPSPGCADCPSSFLLIRVDEQLNDLIWGVGQVINLVIVGVLVAMIIRKRNASSPAARRALSPVVWALGPIGLALVLAFLEPLTGFSTAGSQAVLIVERLALIFFPLALVVGMVRTRLDQARVGGLAVALEDVMTSTELETRIGDALGDPTARLMFWTESNAPPIDTEGRSVHDLGGKSEAVIFTSDGARLGAILYDPAVDEALVTSVAAAATLSMRNESLRAELRRQLIEVERARERIAEAGMEERRRIERDLHDGTQQGLLALGATLSSARSRANGEVAHLLDEAIEDLKRAIDSLREFARGVHPSILTDRGVGPAIETLAERSPVPVKFDVTDERYRPAIESAAYFVVVESLTNTIRHANATTARVTVSAAEGQLIAEVSDDGEGGADVGGGTGLQGLQDRIEALGGQLHVISPPGGGTTVKAVLPCE